jgi:hypothetical protein
MSPIKEKLLQDLRYYFEEDRIKLDQEVDLFYFTNEPGRFLPWSARNIEYSKRNKHLIRKTLITNEVIKLHNMRWYLSTRTLEELEDKINALFA